MASASGFGPLERRNHTCVSLSPARALLRRHTHATRETHSSCFLVLVRTCTHTHTRTYPLTLSLSLSLSHLLAPHLSPIMWKETCLRAFKKRNGYSGGWGQVSFFKESSSLSSEIFSRCGQFFSLQFVGPELLQQQQQPTFSSFISIKKLLIEYHLRNLDEIIVRQESNLRLYLSVKTNQLGVM